MKIILTFTLLLFSINCQSEKLSGAYFAFRDAPENEVLLYKIEIQNNAQAVLSIAWVYDYDQLNTLFDMASNKEKIDYLTKLINKNEIEFYPQITKSFKEINDTTYELTTENTVISSNKIRDSFHIIKLFKENKNLKIHISESGNSRSVIMLSSYETLLYKIE
jgi:indole-3-glycerol phosphate synthase